MLTESGWSGCPFQGVRKSQAPSASEIRAPRCPVCPCFPRHHAGGGVIFTGLNLTTSKRNCAGYLCFETSACAVRRRPPREKQDLCCAAAAHAPGSGAAACPSTTQPTAHDPAPNRYIVAVARGDASTLSDAPHSQISTILTSGLSVSKSNCSNKLAPQHTSSALDGLSHHLDFKVAPRHLAPGNGSKISRR